MAVQHPQRDYRAKEIQYRASDAEWAELHKWMEAATKTWLDAHSADTRNPWLMPDLTPEERIARFQHSGGFMGGFLEGAV
jgi:hypothetical protein